jgi:hypothetical protein
MDIAVTSRNLQRFSLFKLLANKRHQVLVAYGGEFRTVDANYKINRGNKTPINLPDNLIYTPTDTVTNNRRLTDLSTDHYSQAICSSPIV